MSQWDELNQPLDVAPSDKFSASLIKFLKTSIKEPIGNEVRASGLPLCGRSYSFNTVLPPEEIPEKSVDFLLDLQGETGESTV